MQHSAVLIIPADLKAQADAVGAAMGWGGESYTIPLGDGESVTHYGARADVGEQFIRWVRGLEPLLEGMDSAQPVIDALIADFRPDPTYEGEDPPPVLWGRAHLDAVLGALGLMADAQASGDLLSVEDALAALPEWPGV